MRRFQLQPGQLPAAATKLTGVPSPGCCCWRILALRVDIHHITPKRVGGNDDWGNLCLVLRWGTRRVAHLRVTRWGLLPGLAGEDVPLQRSLRSSRMRREAHVRFLGGSLP